MTLTEDNIIKNFAQFFSKLPESVTGIGDDAAVLPAGGSECYIISKDLLVENIHFRLKYFSAADLAYKSLHVNLSDVAAMGAKPLFVLLGIALPPNLDGAWITDFSEAFSTACKIQNVALIGGDTTASPRDVVISITVIGCAEEKHIKYRSGAKTGDVICVAGVLGEASAGLYLLERGLAGFDALKGKCLRPIALVQQGQWLGARPEVTAMMDVSDGLYTDLGRMMEKSGRSAMVQLEGLKPSDLLTQACTKDNLDAIGFMLAGGEDYALLFSVKRDAFDVLAKDFEKNFSYPLQKIGTVSEGGGVKLMQNGVEVPFVYKAFSHFGEN